MPEDIISAYTYKEEDVRQLMMAILHVADLGNCIKPVALHAAWSVQVLHEFFHEAALEKELGLKPLPFMDPEQCYVPTAQMDFL